MRSPATLCCRTRIARRGISRAGGPGQLSDQVDTLWAVDDQFLYRYFDASGASLYNGRSNDWTRRLREHWRDDHWSTGIMSVRVEHYPNLGSVIAAEAASIRTEHPRYNVQHNRPGTPAPDLGAGREWTVEDIILMVGLAVLVGYVVCKGTVIAIEKYGRWKAERDEFQAWKQARVDGTAIKRVEPADELVTVTEPAPVTGPTVPEPEPVIISKPAAPPTHMPAMNPVVAFVLAAMLYRQPQQEAGWMGPLWRQAPPTAQ
jgi:hypothetical protein